MSCVQLGDVRTFDDVKCDKAQALKPLEEAAEVFGAWQELDVWRALAADAPADEDYDMALLDSQHRVLEECSDVIQAVCNLAASVGCHDMTPFMEECERRQRERGRL